MEERIKYIVNLLIIFLLLTSVAIRRDGRVLGYDIEGVGAAVSATPSAKVDRRANGGVWVINSSSLTSTVGYAGRTPVELHVRDGVIERVELLPNVETPSFMQSIEETCFTQQWVGLTLTQAASLWVDAVSGATYSSYAIAENIRSAAQWGADVKPAEQSMFKRLGVKEVAALLVIALGVFITFIKRKSRWLVMMQHALNIVVLGFWCGSFISLSQLVGWVSNGVNITLALIPFTLLLVAIITPVLGRKGSYCHLHCPMGGAQELLGAIPVKKLRISPQANRFLNSLRYYILTLLLMLMWLGVGFEIMDYELFSIFIFSSASTSVIVLATLLLLLSIFTPRPYCRFVCPTGALITMTQRQVEC